MSFKNEKVKTALDFWEIRIDELNKSKYHETRVKIVETLNWLITNLATLFGCFESEVAKSKKGYKYFVRIPLQYRFNYKLENHEVPHLLLFVEPKDITRSFMKIHFKGHPYGLRDWLWARVFIEGIISKKVYRKVFSKIETAALDVRVDIDELLDNFVFDCLNTRTSATFYKGGIPKSYYFNSKKSPFHVGIYSAMNKKEDKKLPDDEYFDTRIELRQRRLKLSMDEVLNEVQLLKKFNRFKVYDMKQMEGCKFLNFYFLLACKMNGLKPILERLSGSEKRKVKEELKRFEMIVVNQNLIESQLRQYMKYAVVLDPSNAEFNDSLKDARIKVEQVYFQK
ncbi:hypothetical protein [Thalassotalea sediminis]|uniref:hypothetical protein n=1 Tax=Thalassotalea sediminis TaxID=1759089 RepID=UPI002572E4B4|nr:hypothetical protein [Thalassotalea sediminis]